MAMINSGKPIDLSFITADERRGTGGDLIEVKKWLKMRDDHKPGEAPSGYTPTFTPKKDRQNHLNKTFTIFSPANRAVHPITVHYRLMTRLNGMRIING